VKWLDNLEREQAENVKNVLANAADKTPAQLEKELREVLVGSQDRAKTIARTESEKVRNSTKMNIMRQNGAQYVKYVAVMDDRVRPDHAALDGKIFAIEDAPILGEANCRCTYVPVSEQEAADAGVETAKQAVDWSKSAEGLIVGEQRLNENSERVEARRSTNDIEE
jgi:SPP1 gp7 family putative phage head morphogenesis protein